MLFWKLTVLLQWFPVDLPPWRKDDSAAVVVHPIQKSADFDLCLFCAVLTDFDHFYPTVPRSVIGQRCEIADSGRTVPQTGCNLEVLHTSTKEGICPVKVCPNALNAARKDRTFHLTLTTMTFPSPKAFSVRKMTRAASCRHVFWRCRWDAKENQTAAARWRGAPSRIIRIHAKSY